MNPDFAPSCISVCRAGGTFPFPQSPTFGEPVLGGAGQAADVQVTTEEVLLFQTYLCTGFLKIVMRKKVRLECLKNQTGVQSNCQGLEKRNFDSKL